MRRRGNMPEKNQPPHERLGFNPFNVGYTPVAPPGYERGKGRWVLKEPGGARSGETPASVWRRGRDEHSS
jgi:hypothetical protein